LTDTVEKVSAKKLWNSTTWLWTELKRLGLPLICIDARHAQAVLKMQINKSDRNDAAGIARIMQTGWFKEVRVKDIDSHSVRALLASRALLVKIKRHLENQIRGLLKNIGLVIGRAKFNGFAARAEELIEDHPELVAAIRPLLEAAQLHLFHRLRRTAYGALLDFYHIEILEHLEAMASATSFGRECC
jgi:transposase